MEQFINSKRLEELDQRMKDRTKRINYLGSFAGEQAHIEATAARNVAYFDSLGTPEERLRRSVASVAVPIIQIGTGFVPWLGDVIGVTGDLGTLNNSQAAGWERNLAGVSLGLTAVTFGASPNVAPIREGLENLFHIGQRERGLGRGLGDMRDYTGSWQPDLFAPDNVLSGHGLWRPGDGFTRIPEGMSLTVYARHGETISDRLGNVIELGGDLAQNVSPRFMRTFRAGDLLPNYWLTPGLDLNISPNAITVNQGMQISDLMTKLPTGTYQWAACLSIADSLDDFTHLRVPSPTRPHLP